MLKKQKNGLNGYLTVPVMFNVKTLWYEPQEIIYTIDPISNELRWNFAWNPVFSAYDSNNIIFENKGHTEAPFKLELPGEIVNPKLEIIDNTGTRTLNLSGLTIQSGDRLIYNTKDTEQQIVKEGDGTETNLFSFLNPNFINFFKLHKGVSTIRLTATNEITSGSLTIYVQYKSV